MTTGSRPAIRWPRYLSFLPSFLFRAEGSKVRYVAGATGLSLLGNLILSAVGVLALPGHVGAPERDVASIGEILGLVLFAPVIETALMAGLVALLARWPGPGAGVVISAILWGCLHGMLSLRWGLAIWWSFLIFGIAFLSWGRAEGAGRGLFVATAIHAAQNSCAVLLLLVAELL